MRQRLRGLTRTLGFLPGAMVVAFAAVGVVLVEVDRSLTLEGVRFIFAGDGSAARTVLSVIAGSLITVAGLTFSITMVALQLTSSQFSPRVLRTFFADRITQVTIGTFVGTFVYALLVLRSVGSFGDPGFVPRLSITVASLLGIAAVVLLIVFLQHVALMIQVSHIMGAIANDTLARVDALYPERYGVSAGDGGEPERWRAERSGRVGPLQPGYVQSVDLEGIAKQVGGVAERVAVLVCPGDFTDIDCPLAEIWPPEAADTCADAVRDAIAVSRERDLEQDVAFGLRQLTDTALKAISPGINDPATAITCIGYLRWILVRLTERDLPATVRAFPEHGVTVAARARGYSEYLEVIWQLNRSLAGDAWLTGELLRTLEACASVARDGHAPQRSQLVLEMAEVVARQSCAEAGNERDRASVARALRAVRDAARRT